MSCTDWMIPNICAVARTLDIGGAQVVIARRWYKSRCFGAFREPIALVAGAAHESEVAPCDDPWQRFLIRSNLFRRPRSRGGSERASARRGSRLGCPPAHLFDLFPRVPIQDSAGLPRSPVRNRVKEVLVEDRRRGGLGSKLPERCGLRRLRIAALKRPGP